MKTTIQIKILSLSNFKGIRKLTIDNFDKETNINGANATGKTSIFDAFTWLLFGKDSTDRTNFEIKTLDKNNKVIPKIDHEVEAIITVNGEEIKLKRTFREKWVKKRGALESEFGGNETIYEWNDVPMTQRDYTAKINDLVNESVFKTITSPTAFNSLKWQDQRQVLLDISGGVTNEEVTKGNPDFENLLTKLTGKSLKEYETQIKSSIRKSKEAIKAIPTRIDEVDKGKPEAIDFADVERDLKANQKELASVDSQIQDKLEAEKEVLANKSKLQKQIHDLESQIEDEKHKLKLQAKSEFKKQSSISDDIQSKIEGKSEDLTKAKRTLKHINEEIEVATAEIKSLQAENDNIRKEWNESNAKEFQMDEDSSKCPTCKRDFESEDVEAKKKELFSNFQDIKMKGLQVLTARGKKNKATIEFLEDNIEEFKKRKIKGDHIEGELIADLEELHAALETAQDNTEVETESDISAELIDSNDEIASMYKKIVKLNAELKAEKGVDTSELKAKRKQAENEIDKIKSKLQAKDQIEAANKRIESLSSEESQLAQTIADYEKDQYTIEQFNRAKDNALEQLVNDRFELVTFKLFETQVNGGETPTCKALINGVPFSDANTASKINAGVDIINVLCDYYKVTAPIFIDNRESVTKLIDSDSQIINLVVDPSKKKLEVKSLKTAEMF